MKLPAGRLNDTLSSAVTALSASPYTLLTPTIRNASALRAGPGPPLRRNIALPLPVLRFRRPRAPHLRSYGRPASATLGPRPEPGVYLTPPPYAA
ncbi:hypothetical protein GCM10022245_30700 [Streptomyces mayteni]